MRKIEPDDPQMLAGMKYETRDFSMKQVGGFVIGMILFAILGVVGATGIFLWMNPGITQKSSISQPFAKIPDAPNPILQTNITAKTDLEDLRKAENDTLHRYGYADQAKTKVHVPVERAIEMMSGGK